jgi:hypothetical protein
VCIEGPLREEVGAQRARITGELLGAHHVERARPRQRDVVGRGDAARPLAHHQHPVRQEDRLGNAVGDQQHRLAGGHPDALQFEVHALARHRVERAERLVHQQHRRIVQQRPQDRDALLHAARELPRVLVLEAFQVGHLDEAVGALARRLHRHAADLGLQQDVVEHAPPRQQQRALEHDAHVGLRAAHRLARQAELAAAGGQEAGHHLHQGALAAARRADDRDELAGPDLEVQRLQRLDLAVLGAVGLAHAARMDQHFGAR